MKVIIENWNLSKYTWKIKSYKKVPKDKNMKLTFGTHFDAQNVIHSIDCGQNYKKVLHSQKFRKFHRKKKKEKYMKPTQEPNLMSRI